MLTDSLLAIALDAPDSPTSWGAAWRALVAGIVLASPFMYLWLRAQRTQRIAEGRLRRSESKFRHVIDDSPVAIMGIDNDDRVTLWSPRATELFGWTADEIIGRPLPIIPPEIQDQFVHARHRELRGERVDPRERVYRRKDGTTLNAVVTSSPEFDTSGTVIGTIAHMVDLSRQRDLEQQLRQSQKMEAVGQLAGGIAHDFNNMLTVILAHTTMLAQAMPDEGYERESVSEIEKASMAAAGLTRQLLAFSRKQVLNPVDMPLNDSIAGFGRLLPRILGDDIEVELRLDDDPLFVVADPGQLEQVLINLAVNSRDAMPYGGLLVIETDIVDAEHDPVVCVDGLVSCGKHARLSVRDSGLGMTPDVQSRMFEPFFTTKDPGRGTGLGLSTVFGIVKQSKGHLAVASAPGRGTTVSILIPLQTCTPPEAPSGNAPAFSLSSGTETILLVEDSGQLRTLVRQTLTRRGYTVIEAQDGAAAIEAADRWGGRIDLVLTDAVMPRVCGGELVRTLRELHPDIRVLYMSGYTENELMRANLTGEQENLVHKPFTQDDIVAAVRRTLDIPEHQAT